jgi:hypothetical protein
MVPTALRWTESRKWRVNFQVMQNTLIDYSQILLPFPSENTREAVSRSHENLPDPLVLFLCTNPRRRRDYIYMTKRRLVSDEGH